MSQRITFVLDLFRPGVDRDLSDVSLRALLECLVNLDEMHLRTHPRTPGLYESGVVYREEPPGAEDWQDIPTTLAMECGDCEDLACWRAAELRVRRGVRAVADFTRETQADGTVLYHIVVRLPDGSIEDPSRLLGMR